jgi:hypothetical protein
MAKLKVIGRATLKHTYEEIMSVRMEDFIRRANILASSYKYDSKVQIQMYKRQLLFVVT